MSKNLWRVPAKTPGTPLYIGGGERARTDGLLLAKQALSQLSYTPKLYPSPALYITIKVVGLVRFELTTSRLSGVRSNQLSYRPTRPETD